MCDKIKNIILTALLALMIFGLGAYMLISPSQEFSESERRVLAQFPETSVKTLLNGSFMKDFETYTLDQFPFRDTFRSVKMFSALKVFNNLTANDLYTFGDYVIKQEYPLDEKVVQGNLDTINRVFASCVEGKTDRIFFSLIPDKNYYFSKISGRLSFDWTALEGIVSDKAEWSEYIDITDTLTGDSYYMTDTHWSQDKILDTADRVLSSLGKDMPGDYTENTLDKEFWGVYTGQLMLPLKADKIVYLTNEIIDSYEVTSLDSMGNQQKDHVYNHAKLDSKDTYDFFMSGAVPLVVINNPTVTDGSHLILFRDSFGSSLAPLLAQCYSKTTVIDLRYINPSFLSFFADFNNADVLFMYSPLVLNSPSVLQG